MGFRRKKILGKGPKENGKKGAKKTLSDVNSVMNDAALLLNLATEKDNVLPVVRNNTFSMKTLKPDAFQEKAESYNNHVKASVAKALGGKQIYFRFRVQESLHKISRPKDAVVYQCHICKGPYKQKFSLKRHFLRNHINPEYISAADLSNCKIPIQNEEIIQQFVEESKTPSGRKRFKTNGAVFFIPDGKTRVPGLYKCHQCPGIRFDLEDELEAHYSSHLNLNRDDVFPCNLCPSVFQRKQALSKHMVSHTEKKIIFHCKKCPQQFEKITDYTCHLQMHGSGKRCKYCEKEFSTAANRKRHENIHERGRVFSCRLCKAKFSRSKELEKHIKKMHSNLKLTCPHCPMQTSPIIFTSQYLFEAHIALKHRDIPGKKFVTSNKTTGLYKTHMQKLPKESFCCYCKKKFSSVKAMVNHKNAVHKNEIAQHKPKKFGQKEITKGKLQRNPEGNQKLKNLPINEKDHCEKNSKSDNYVKTGILGKKRTTYERKAKNSSQYKLSKDKSYRKKDEAEKLFYFNVSSNVADNLLNHVDGGPNQINLKKSGFQDSSESFDYRSNTSEIPWSAHNFSNCFDSDGVMSKREEKSLLFPQERCLYATGLERNEVSVENTVNLSSSDEGTMHSDNQEEKEKLINNEFCATYVCGVCKGIFPDYSAFEDHSVNNHPNVEISFVEIEGTSNNPPDVPGELRRPPYTLPNGMLISYEVSLPTQVHFDNICSKCESRFDTKDELYAHIFQCTTETDIHFRKKLNQRNKKGFAMKNRIDSSRKPIKSSGWFNRNKQIFKSGCFRRNKFQSGKYYFDMESNERDKRSPQSSKLCANRCPHAFCESVFISAAKLPEHTEVCPNKFKSHTAEEQKSKKYQMKKSKDNQSLEHSPSPISYNESGSSNDPVKNSNISDTGTLSTFTYDNALPVELQEEVHDDKTVSSENQCLNAPPSNNLQSSVEKENDADLYCEKTVGLERNTSKTSPLLDLDILRKLVKKVESALCKNDLQMEDVTEKSVKKVSEHSTKTESSVKKVSENSAKNIDELKLPVGSIISANSKKRVSENAVKNTKSGNVTKSVESSSSESTADLSTVGTAEILPKVNLPKIKEVVKEIQLAASSSPNLKKSNTPLTFLSPEVNQNVEHSSPNKNLLVSNGMHSRSVKESSVTNESQQSEKARQRKKRKPIKIMHKMIDETENNLKINLTSFSLEENSFKPIENSGKHILSTNMYAQIVKSPDMVPEKNKMDFHSSNEKSTTIILESAAVDSTKNTQINTDEGKISTPVFLPQENPEGSEDRDSPSLEVLVSSVTQSIENFDKPSLLDDEKFALQTSDLINPTTLKNTDMDLTSNNGLNFKIIIPTSDSPSISQASDKDALNYFASGITGDESPMPVSIDKNNVKTSVINKMKSILNVTENASDTARLKESINSKIKNTVTPLIENTIPVTENTQKLTPGENKSVVNSATVNLHADVSPEFQRSLSFDKSIKESRKENEENEMGKSFLKEKGDNKKRNDNKKGDNDSFDGDEYSSKKSGHGQLAMVDKNNIVNLTPEQKFKQPKDKMKSKVIEVVQSTSTENGKNESQMKKVNLKPSLDKKCSEDDKGMSSKSPVNNNTQPQLALEVDNHLTNKNKVEDCIPSENSAKLRLLRMKRPALNESSDKAANENMKLSNSSESDNSNTQMSKRRKSINDSGAVAGMHISDQASLGNSLDPAAVANSMDPAVVNSTDQAAMVDSSGVYNLESITAKASMDDGCCSKASDYSYPAIDDKNIVVKKEKSDNELFLQRNCPYCFLDFAYLSNFRRHLKQCPSRTMNVESETPVASTSSQFQHLPKKNEVEESMLNLLRHQSRQYELIKETQDAEDSKPKISFRKFSCPRCHKIYLSYFSFIQHVFQVHKMKTANAGDASTSQSMKVLPLEEIERDMHQETKIEDIGGASTSQDAKVMPLEENGKENNINLPEICDNTYDISSELTDNGMNSSAIVGNSVEKIDQANANKKEENFSSNIPFHELKSDNKEIMLGSELNVTKCTENINSSDSSNLTGKEIKTFSSSDGRNVSNSQNDKEFTDPSLLVLPAYGKGRGRKKKSIAENLSEKKIESTIEEQSCRTEDTSAVSEPKATDTVTNNSMLKEVGESLLVNLKSSKSTLVNKLRSTLSKSMQNGVNLKDTPTKFVKKTGTLKSADSDPKHLDKDSCSLKSHIKKNAIETLKATDKTNAHHISHPLNTSRRGRKKSVVTRIPVKQNIKGYKREANNNLSLIDVPSEVVDSSAEAMETESNSRLDDSSKINKLKSLRNQSLPSTGSLTISKEKKNYIKKINTNTPQSNKMTKATKPTKPSFQEVNPDVQASQKSKVNNKTRSSKSIKANCDNEPIPSTSYGPSRSRNSKVINISLDLSSEPEDADDIQQNKTKQKRKPNNKICPICKQKFPAMLQRNRHLQLVHGRNRSRTEGSISPTSVPVKKESASKMTDSPVKKETVNKVIDSSAKKENKVADSPAIVPDRSAYQRQCSKPLPPLKRKYQKVGGKNIQPVKKTKS
ncbi:Telomere zinc finger-associated protein like [Argiope bruennichi]|uniref:Telomere zinc finger-associated protein like n=1 Tax=Argiope bruennichi TaxID=94029 RepID=A0A8T0F7P0_ARGBR|nr:Telomere zinc finger-associated protein like [Argiope bruennichi]